MITTLSQPAMTAPTVKPPNTPSPPSGSQSGRKSKLQVLIPIGLAAIAATGAGIWYFLSASARDVLKLSGQVEGYETNVAARVSGRVESIAVREGEEVRRGQVLAHLSGEQVQAQLRQAAARVAAARQQEQQAKLQIAAIEQQLRQAQIVAQQSTGNATGLMSQATATIAAAKAQLAQADAQAKQAESELKLAMANRERYAALAAQGAINRQQFDQAQVAAETAQATLQARQATALSAREQLSAAQGGLLQVQFASPALQKDQLITLTRQRDRAYAQLKQAQVEVKNALAVQQQIQSQVAYLTVPSPISGVVATRSVEPGAVVANGKTLVSVIDLNSVYLRGFVPEKEIGKIRVGQRAKVWLNSNPDQPMVARVAAIDPRSSTPEMVYFRNDRVQQVFGVKLIIENPTGFAKPGMPANAEIAVNEG